MYEGRVDDSLYFSVTNAASATAGFRYDLAADEAVASEDLIVPGATTAPRRSSGVSVLRYLAPGAELFPWGIWAPYVSVAGALRARCEFEAALRWYEAALNPLTADCTWVHC